MVAATETPSETAHQAAAIHTLENETLRATIGDYAGALVSLEAPDRAGRRDHVVLGFDTVDAYRAAGGSFGALLGRNANRIAGGVVAIDGKTYTLSENERAATLHGGKHGFDKRFWTVVEKDARAITLSLVSSDGDQGFPGEVTVRATYRLEGTALRLVLAATTTAPTPLSLSAHPYFNLDGLEGRDCLDHEIMIAAEKFLPTDAEQLPTGETRCIASTPFDFRTPCRIGARIRTPDPQLRYGRGYDHYYVLPPTGPDRLRLAARVSSPRSGRILEVLTTQRGVQFYTGNNLNGSVAGRGGLYRQSAGFALEPQGFPDAPHHSNFPSTILRPGQPYREEIVYRFTTDTAGAPA